MVGIDVTLGHGLQEKHGRRSHDTQVQQTGKQFRIQALRQSVHTLPAARGEHPDAAHERHAKHLGGSQLNRNVLARTTGEQHDVSRIGQRAQHRGGVCQQVGAAVVGHQANAQAGERSCDEHGAVRARAPGPRQHRHHQDIQAGKKCAAVGGNELQSECLTHIGCQHQRPHDSAIAPSVERHLEYPRCHAGCGDQKSQGGNFHATQRRCGQLENGERSPPNDGDEQQGRNVAVQPQAHKAQKCAYSPRYAARTLGSLSICLASPVMVMTPDSIT